MVVEKNNKVEDYKFKKGNLNFAVVGHVEWINFLKVDQLPKPGVITHSEKSLEYPALILFQVHSVFRAGKISIK